MVSQAVKYASIVVPFCVLWLLLILDLTPLTLTRQMKELLWIAPIYALIAFACYSMASVAIGVATLKDKPEEAESLKKEIKEAKEDLRRKGFKFE